MKKWFTSFIGGLLVLSGCTGPPEGIQPVTPFDLERYLGTWHEIARLDHRFERGLEQVTAQYSRNDDGSVGVLNRGFNTEKKQWQEAEGKAYLVGAPDVGHLKVSFFGPFYGGYIIVALDQKDYQYAMVCGPSRKYLWILARTSPMNPDRLNELIAQAKTLGFETDSLIFPAPSQKP